MGTEGREWLARPLTGLAASRLAIVHGEAHARESPELEPSEESHGGDGRRGVL